jgi:hypothetical protein
LLDLNTKISPQAGNDKLDLERREREAREKWLAKRKLKDLETSMKEKAMAQARAEAESEAEALAAAEEAAKLIAMDITPRDTDMADTAEQVVDNSSAEEDGDEDGEVIEEDGEIVEGVLVPQDSGHAYRDHQPDSSEDDQSSVNDDDGVLGTPLVNQSQPQTRSGTEPSKSKNKKRKAPVTQESQEAKRQRKIEKRRSKKEKKARLAQQQQQMSKSKKAKKGEKTEQKG